MAARHDLAAVAARARRAGHDHIGPGPADAGPGREEADRRTLLLEAVIAGTVLGEALFAALRRLAQEDASARWLVDGGSEPARD